MFNSFQVEIWGWNSVLSCSSAMKKKQKKNKDLSDDSSMQERLFD